MSALKSPVDLDQHRRYSISLIVLISTTIFILLHVDLPAAPHHFLGQYPFSSHIESVHPSLGYVEGEIVMSELYYQESLKERQRLINKWRSTVGKVESFPSHGESYTLCKVVLYTLATASPNVNSQGTSFHPPFNAHTE